MSDLVERLKQCRPSTPAIEAAVEILRLRAEVKSARLAALREALSACAAQKCTLDCDKMREQIDMEVSDLIHHENAKVEDCIDAITDLITQEEADAR